jgi:hypothetical protein
MGKLVLDREVHAAVAEDLPTLMDRITVLAAAPTGMLPRDRMARLWRAQLVSLEEVLRRDFHNEAGNDGSGSLGFRGPDPDQRARELLDEHRGILSAIGDLRTRLREGLDPAFMGLLLEALLHRIERHEEGEVSVERRGGVQDQGTAD